MVANTFREYATAFEDVVKTDDFRRLEPFFAEDAVYEIRGGPPFAGRHVGRAAILAYLKASLDGFDRRFQTRRLDIRGRFPADQGGTKPIATLNGTLCAMTRTIVAILETHQQADGSVTVPQALRPYLGGLEVLKPLS